MRVITERSLIKEFEECGLIIDLKTPIRNRSARFNQNIVRVPEHVTDNSTIRLLTMWKKSVKGYH